MPKSFIRLLLLLEISPTLSSLEWKHPNRTSNNIDRNESNSELGVQIVLTINQNKRANKFNDI